MCKEYKEITLKSSLNTRYLLSLLYFVQQIVDGW